MKIEWDNDDHTILRITVRHPWTWDDYDQMVDESMVMIAAQDHRVDVMFDMRDGGARPPGPDGIKHFRRAWYKLPSNTGMLINVGIGGLMRSLVTVFIRATGQSDVVAMVHDMDEAYEIIGYQQERRRSA